MTNFSTRSLFTFATKWFGEDHETKVVLVFAIFDAIDVNLNNSGCFSGKLVVSRVSRSTGRNGTKTQWHWDQVNKKLVTYSVIINSYLKFLHGGSLKLHFGHSVWDPGEWFFSLVKFRSIGDIISLFLGSKRILRIPRVRWFLIEPVPCRHIVRLTAMRLERVQREPKLESISWIDKFFLNPDRGPRRRTSHSTEPCF